jgi:hypothetical protein
MIELSHEQRQAISQGESIRVSDNGLECVVIRADVFDKFKAYDDSEWTDGEMDLLAEEAGDLLDKYQP